MLNLVSQNSELYDQFPQLYRRARDQWQKVVGGVVALIPFAAIASVSIESANNNATTLTTGALALAAAGVTGYGLGQLQETSRTFEEALQTHPPANSKLA
jgi:hypothetical protein